MAENFLGKELLICRYHSNKHKCQGMEQTSMLKILQEKIELFLRLKNSSGFNNHF